jgi:hypothetical protein
MGKFALGGALINHRYFGFLGKNGDNSQRSEIFESFRVWTQLKFCSKTRSRVRFATIAAATTGAHQRCGTKDSEAARKSWRSAWNLA